MEPDAARETIQSQLSTANQAFDILIDEHHETVHACSSQHEEALEAYKEMSIASKSLNAEVGEEQRKRR